MIWQVVGSVCVAITLLSAAPATARQIPDARFTGLTKDRLSPEKMQSLVAGPFALVARGDLAGGQAAFEQQLTDLKGDHGGDSVVVADALSSFGVTLFNSGRNEARRASVPYLHRAVTAMQAAFGPQHPEVALALNDYADVVEILELDPSAGDSIAALREATAIRQATLGPANAETVSTAITLAAALSRPQRVGGTPAMQAEAQAIATILVDRYGHDRALASRARLMHGAAMVYAQCGDAGRAEAALRRMPRDTYDERLSLAIAAAEVADTFGKIGRQPEAEAVRRNFPSLLDALRSQ